MVTLGAAAGRGRLPAPAPRPDARDVVLAALSRRGAVSRAELVRETGLAASTVSTVVGELLAAGLAVDMPGRTVPATGARGGRPATLLALHRSAGVAVGVDLGKRHVRVAVADLAHVLLAEGSRPLPADWPAAEGIAVVADLVEVLLRRAGVPRDQVIGVGMGIPGPVRATGELGDSTILPGWVGVQAAAAVAAALDLPVHVDNDANLGALGEWTWGAARGSGEVAYLKIATGIGAGLLLDGRPYTGIGGTAGEIGHIVVDPSGPVCRCGNRGCLEVVAGGDAVLAALRLTHGELGLREVVALARRGDHGCRRVLADSGRSIGEAVAVLCNLLNPGLVVVGGELGAADDLLLPSLRESLARSAVRSAAQDVAVVPAALGERAEVLGALALAVRCGAPLTADGARAGAPSA
ncbi:Sugar kinase of the NBD/HSP70 family, may contain an N-terminal HTH domain [Quadrisphaera sp. DSM 44207]|nr:Sugar kinase of the NBD/HSP70 family, may contain an N-terminal HTH domain [Quadrisphaera sp. DSM 44207]